MASPAKADVPVFDATTHQKLDELIKMTKNIQDMDASFYQKTIHQNPPPGVTPAHDVRNDLNKPKTKDPRPDDSVNSIAIKMARKTLEDMTGKFVNLIRTGGQGGGPLFVTNWQDFLLDSADQASGVFLKELNLTQLCEPFAPRLRLVLSRGRQSLNERYRCTISTVIGNVQGFFNDFNNGGWQRWVEFTIAPNNPYTTFLDLQAEKERREAAASGASFNEAQAGSGFLNMKECEEIAIDGDIGYGDPETKTVCETVSPGKWLERRLSEFTDSDITQLNLGDDVDEILLESFNQILTTLVYDTGGLLESQTGSVTTTSDTSPPSVSITNPANGDLVSGSILIAATAFDNTSVAAVKFFADGAELIPEDNLVPFSKLWDSTATTSGQHQISAEARDPAGNKSLKSINITVDNIKPAVSITAPSGGSTVSGIIALSATSTDNAGVAGVRFYIGNQWAGEEDVFAPYSVFWNTADRPNGTYPLSAQSRDKAGNFGTSTPISITIQN